MISQELMLGDWVMLNPDLKGYYSFAGKPCMVIGLHDDDGAIKIEYDNGKYFWTDAEDDVLPIPLTQEILEKNGFTKNVLSEKKYYLAVEGFEIHVYFAHVNTQLIIEKRNGREIINILNIKYLHILQHALKLCGIDKTIKL